MSDDLTERLRDAWIYDSDGFPAPDLPREAADRIDALTAENAALRARLKTPGEGKLDKAQRVAAIYRFEDADGEIRLGDVIGALRADLAEARAALTWCVAQPPEHESMEAWDAWLAKKPAGYGDTVDRAALAPKEPPHAE